MFNDILSSFDPNIFAENRNHDDDVDEFLSREYTLRNASIYDTSVIDPNQLTANQSILTTGSQLGRRIGNSDENNLKIVDNTLNDTDSNDIDRQIFENLGSMDIFDHGGAHFTLNNPMSTVAQFFDMPSSQIATLGSNGGAGDCDGDGGGGGGEASFEISNESLTEDPFRSEMYNSVSLLDVSSALSSNKCTPRNSKQLLSATTPLSVTDPLVAKVPSKRSRTIPTPKRTVRRRKRGRGPAGSTRFDGTRQFKCSMCIKAFLSRHHLTRHLACVHSVEKPFTCPKCRRGFKRKDHVRQHLKRKFKCST